jgi:F-type H+-transporting ATPase subunit b
MQIDWFTVSAQTLNFLLLVWLLKRYLYGPILKAIDARESQVAKVISDADTIKSNAELQCNLFKNKNIEIDNQRDELLRQANVIAHEQHEQIVLQANKNADEISKGRLLALEKELQHYQDEIVLKILQEIYEIARKVMADLADVELEQQMFEHFCKHLQNISCDEINNLNKTLEEGNAVLRLCSAFELSTTQIKKIDATLQQLTAHKLTTQKLVTTKTNRHYQLKQEVKTQLISGIELRSNTWKIAWNSDDYLKVLQTHVNHTLVEQQETINNRIAQLNVNLSVHLSVNPDTAKVLV